MFIIGMPRTGTSILHDILARATANRAQFFVRSYQDWVDREADWSHVYDFHLQQLQHLQVFNRRDRWVLKTGAHLWGLEHLLATYPDARIVFTHRDPVDSMTLEGRARAGAEEADVDGVQVVHVPGEGDDTIAVIARADRDVVVVTADRELAERVRAADAEVVGPSWRLERLVDE